MSKRFCRPSSFIASPTRKFTDTPAARAFCFARSIERFVQSPLLIGNEAVDLFGVVTASIGLENRCGFLFLRIGRTV